MIICTQCGFSNDDGDRFCGGCQEFLEWTGEAVDVVDEPEPDDEPDEVDDRKGLVVRVVERFSGHDDSPSGDVAAATTLDGTTPSEGSAGTGVATDEADALRAEAVARAEQEAEAAEQAHREAEARLKEEAEAAEAAQHRAEEAAAARRAAEEEARQLAEAAAAERAGPDPVEEPAAPASPPTTVAASGDDEVTETVGESVAAAVDEPAADDPAADASAEAERAEAARVAAEASARVEAEAESAAREAAEAEAARKAAEAAVKAEAEAAARARRAAALVARPPSRPPAGTAAGPGVVAPGQAQRPDRRAARTGRKPEPGESAEVTATDTGPTAVKPGRSKVRPAAASTKAAPKRKLRPGDLVCGKCGEGNNPSRNFCSRCGQTLAEAEVVRVPWYRRLFRRKPKVYEAGTRPSRGTGGTGGRGTRAKVGALRRVVLGPVGRITRLLAIVAAAAAAIGLTFNPDLRGTVMDTAGGWFSSVWGIVSPQYEPINAQDAQATSAIGDHPALDAVDLASNTWWAAEPNEDDGVGERLFITFAEPVDIAVIGVISGAAQDFVDEPRPQTLHFVFDNGVTHTLDIADSHDFQDFQISDADAITSVEVQVLGVWRGQVGSSVSITEIEFRTRK